MHGECGDPDGDGDDLDGESDDLDGDRDGPDDALYVRAPLWVRDGRQIFPNVRHLFPHRFALVSSLEPNRHLPNPGPGKKVLLEKHPRIRCPVQLWIVRQLRVRFIDNPSTRAATARLLTNIILLIFSSLFWSLRDPEFNFIQPVFIVTLSLIHIVVRENER